MSESLTTNRFDSHILYTLEDFTPDETARGNKLAVAVIQEGSYICKRCGSQDEDLYEEYCR